jgi:hypothetical protein
MKVRQVSQVKAYARFWRRFFIVAATHDSLGALVLRAALGACAKTVHSFIRPRGPTGALALQMHFFDRVSCIRYKLVPVFVVPCDIVSGSMLHSCHRLLLC